MLIKNPQKIHRSKIRIEEIIPSSLSMLAGYIGYRSYYGEPDPAIPQLAANIKKLGLLKPITVRKISDDYRHQVWKKVNLLGYRLPKNVKGSEIFEIYDGIRRYWAFKRLNKKYPGKGWNKIPVIVIDDPEVLDSWISWRHFPNHLVKLGTRVLPDN